MLSFVLKKKKKKKKVKDSVLLNFLCVWECEEQDRYSMDVRKSPISFHSKTYFIVCRTQQGGKEWGTILALAKYLY